MLSEISQRKTNTYGIIYMWNLKNKLVNITKQKQTHRHREQTSGSQWGGGGGRGTIGEGDEEVQATMYKIIYKDTLYHTGNLANIL